MQLPGFNTKILFTMFVASGFSGLLYQVVWTRLAFASFGVNTPVLSVVISVFMLGLAVGTWLAGIWASRVKSAPRRSNLFYYGVVECGIVIGAFSVPWCFQLGEALLQTSGSQEQLPYFLRSSLAITISIAPWCVLMGCTFPLMAGFLKEIDHRNNSGFSFLYLGNVIGATLGVIGTAFVLIELLGFAATLMVGGSINLLVGFTAIFLSERRSGKALNISRAVKPTLHRPIDDSSETKVLVVLFLTGFISMAMEVVWIRAFTPILGTTIYAFAAVLAVYLISTFLGTVAYRITFMGVIASRLDLMVPLTLIAAVFPLWAADPAITTNRLLPLLSIFPVCFLLGGLTPALIDKVSGGLPRGIGRAYFTNIAGSIAGPLVAGYFLLPEFGAKWSLLGLLIVGGATLLMFVPNFAGRSVNLVIVVAGVTVGSAIFSTTLEDSDYYERKYGDVQLRRDYVATVISHREEAKNPMTDRLLVNGVGLTHKTTVTKMMAHLPMYFYGPGAKNALVICFGMGTTVRSMRSWGVDVTAVELVPSVKNAFSFYFKDAAAVLADPKIEIVVDDGRRYLARTQQSFDVITIDPPPPVESAGSSLLYSEEFYKLASKRLSTQGIVAQWYPEGEGLVLEAVVGAIVEVFPFVRLFKSHEGWGYHILASNSPLSEKSLHNVSISLPKPVQADLSEWTPEGGINSVFTRTKEISVYSILLEGEPKRSISDDWPINEYFFLRRGREFFIRALTRTKSH